MCKKCYLNLFLATVDIILIKTMKITQAWATTPLHLRKNDCIFPFPSETSNVAGMNEQK